MNEIFNSRRIRIGLAALITVIFICGLVYSVFSAETKGAADARVIQKTAAFLPDQDKGALKDRLISEAKEEVILKAISGLVHTAVIKVEKARILQCMKKNADDLFSEFVIISEKEENNSYTVSISAKINQTVLGSRLYACVREKRALLIISEKKSGMTQKDGHISPAVVEVLKKKMMNLYDLQGKINKASKKYADAAREGSRDEAFILGRYYLAEYLIVASAAAEFSEQAMDIYSARASGRVEVYRIRDRKQLFSSRLEQLKGFGSNKDKAVDDALKVCAKEISKIVSNVLDIK